MRKFKNNKGITMLELIVIVMVLIILTAVAIDVVVNDQAVDKAEDVIRQANNETVQGQEQESNVIEDYNSKPGKSVIVPSTQNGNEKLSFPGERVRTKTAYNDGSGTYPAQIPAGWTVSGKDGETSIDGGLVIYYINDKTDEQISAIDWTNSTVTEGLRTTYDQFVWIPVNDANDMFMCQSEDGTKSCRITLQNDVATCTTHSSTLMAGRLYATSTGENFNTSLTNQTYNANSGLREPAIVSGSMGIFMDGASLYLDKMSAILGTTGYDSKEHFKNTLQTEYNDIVTSVIENKGFWVGRYETSGMTDVASGYNIKVIAGTTTGIYDITWYSAYAQQKKYASSKGLKGGMISGAAYDQVMKFVNRTENNVSAVVTANHVGHSIGDFTTNPYPYQTGGINYSINYNGTVNNGNYGDIWKNIYDLEGNVVEWTTEAYGTEYRIYRGGSCTGSYSASCCNNRGPDLTFTDLGSRSSLYL